MKFFAAVSAVILAVQVQGKVQYAGVNIAGCDFGCNTDGYCSGQACPSGIGPTQMRHFASKDNLNLFRIPFGWQYMVNYNLGGPLDPTFFATYDALVKACLNTGARCVLDCHNYARWDGGVIAQGGPSDEQFASLWSQLAQKYRRNSRVIFGIMNEPHDLDIYRWAETANAVIRAIRDAGAKTQLILVPGMDYANAGAFPTNSGPALERVVDTDGSHRRIIYEVHQYYDADSSGRNTECVTDHISDAWDNLAPYLRDQGRKVIVGETGGGNTDSCEQYICAALNYLNANSDVYFGWIGWAAGSFGRDYELSEVPYKGRDTSLVRKCIAGRFRKNQ